MDYKEKLKLAKEALESGSYDRETIEYIFPELKESEDERMMNNLHSWMKEFGGAEEYTEKVYQWIKGLLEKQGKNKDLPNVTDRETLDEYAYQVAYDLSNDWLKETPTWDDVEIATKLGANWREKQCSDANKERWRGYREGKQAVLDKYAELKKQGEQNTGEWSEDDEKKVATITDTLLREKYYHPEWSPFLDDQIDWLKSIKERIN